jgi:tetrapyrrole methylase family protein/MazG family protein
MTPYAIEEVFEMVDAIHAGRSDAVCEELGDALFHLIFIIQCYAEQGQFTLEDVINGITTKMVRRHPHVFSSAEADTQEKIRQQWHEIKQGEHHQDTSLSILDSIPTGLPALLRAYRISERAARAGFDWYDVQGVMEKAEEEWDEFKKEVARKPSSSEALSPNANDKQALELGDMFFTLINVARLSGLHPETVLSQSTQKFERRFRCMEDMINDAGDQMGSISRQEWDRLWEAAKEQTG